MILVFEWDTNFTLPVTGDKVVISDPSLGLVRPFNSQTDQEGAVIGVVLSKSSRSVQLANGFDGPLYAIYGPYVTDEDLSQPVDSLGAQVHNPAAQVLQPFTDTRLVFVATGKAMVAVKKPYTGSPLVLIHHTNFDWCII